MKHRPRLIEDIEHHIFAFEHIFGEDRDLGVLVTAQI